MTEILRITAAAQDRLAALHAACFDKPWSAREFASLLHIGSSIGLIARREEGDAGLALIRAAGGEAEVLTIGVIPAARRAGLAQALLDKAEKAAENAGAARIFLEVSTRNAPASSLYENAGYVEIGRRKAYYADGADALVLEKRLTS